MVRFEDQSVAVAQVDGHVLAVGADAWPPRHEVFGGCGSTQVRQPVLESLSHSGTQFELCLGLTLADGAERLGVKGEFQRPGPSR